jgi:tetratricopeptide (TPR) repeat protein
VRAEPAAALLALTLFFSGCTSAPEVQRNTLQTAALSSSQAAARALARNDLAQARQLYERALASADAVEDFLLSGALQVNLAWVHQRQGDAAAAQARLERVLAAPQRYGPSLTSAAATRRALLHLDAGNLSAAAEWAQRAQAACVSPCEQAAALATLQAQMAWQRQDATATVRLAETALAAALASNQANEQANALRLRGRARAELGATAEAAADLAQALAIDQRLGLPERIALGLAWAGDVEHRRGQRAAARDFYERALVVYQAAGLSAAAEKLRVRLVGLTSAP